MERPAVELATRRILPLLALCLFINVIDRSNVGIAALHMRADIALSASAYGVGAGIFYLGFFFAGVPAQLMLARIGARRWIACMLVGWGITATATGFVQDAAHFYLVRFALGVTEAGFLPAVAYYLGQWFDRRAMSKIMGLLIAMLPISVAIGAPLATGLLMTVGWRWLFIIEGLPALAVAVLVLRALPDQIKGTKWLTPAQQDEMAALLVADDAHRQAGSWREALTHPQVILLAIQYFCISLGGQAISFWLPQILMGSGMSASTSGLFSALPWVLSAILTPLWASHASRTNERYWHAILPCIASGVCMVAGALMLAQPIAAVLLLSLGVGLSSMAVAAYWAIPRVHIYGAAAAAAGAFTNSFANLAGFVAPVAVGVFKDLTGGYGLVLVLLSLPLFLAAVCSAIAGRMAELPRKDA